MLADLDRDLSALVPRLRDVRHDLHRHPELGFEEHRTQGVVRAWLEELGYAPVECAETGLIADLRPDLGSTIALRADLDALPMQEETDLPYRSIHDGRAHKCGHDGHTTILMGVASLLAACRDQLENNVRLLFQPAEEGVRGGGAQVMVSEGALEGVREVYGLHNWPGFPKGEVRVRPGALMAQVDDFEIEIEGKGGHGGLPQHCRDPIVAGAHVVTAIQAAVARGVGSRSISVVTVGAFQSGTAHNVIPRTARMLGTMRTFDPVVRSDLLIRLREVVEATAVAHGTHARLEVDPQYPVLINDGDCAQAVRRVAEAVVGPEHVSGDGMPLAAAEDFAFFAREVPSAYFFLGAGEPGVDTPGCHHPDFDFDDDLLSTGIKMFLGLVRDRCAPRGPVRSTGAGADPAR